MEAMEIIMVVLSCLFAVSEILAQLDFFKSNSVFQLIFNILKALAGSKDNGSMDGPKE